MNTFCLTFHVKIFFFNFKKKVPLVLVVEVALAMGASGNSCHGYCGQGI